MRRARCCSISAPGEWDPELAELFRVPLSLLPEVRDCAADFGTTAICSAAPIRILGIAGDQQAATIGQGCFKPGMMKSTYGTGCFALLNTGDTPVASRNRLLTTIAYQLDGKRTYALEGAIFIAGAAVQWLRDGLKLIATRRRDRHARGRSRSGRSRSIWCRPLSGSARRGGTREARGALFGLTPQVRRRRDQRARRWNRSATRPATCSTRCAPTGRPPGAGTVLRVDGGMTASD